MKNITSIVIVICSSFSFYLNGQTAGFNYVPLEFDNLEPEWIHDIYDSTIIGHVVDTNPTVKFDGYSHVVRHHYTSPRFLVTDDAVYLASRIQYDNDVGGAIIERLDLETGELEWKTLFDLRTQDIREYVMNLKIENGRLVLYCIYLNEDNPYISTMTGSGLGYLSRKEYNVENGELLLQTIPDAINNDLVLLVTPSYHSELHLIDDNRIQVIRHGSKFDSGSFLKIDTMDVEGIRLKPSYTLSHELDLDWDDVYLLRSHVFEKDKFTGDIYSIDYFRPNSQGPEARTSHLLRYGRNNISEVVPFEYQEYDELGAIHIRRITETHLIMYAAKEGNLGVDFLLVDKNTGEIDRKIHHNKRIELSSDVLLLDDEITIINVNKEGTYYSMEIYRSDGSEMHLLRIFKLDFPNYVILGTALHELDNGDFLLEFQYSGRRPNGLPIGFFSGIMRITSEQLGLRTSTQEVSDVSIAPYTIYPNPVSDELYIKSNGEATYNL